MRQLDEAADGITAARLSALAVVAKRGPLTLGALAEAEQVQPPTMSRIAARLEEAGLLQRTTQPGDRRVTLVEATDSGRRVLAASRSRRTAYLAERLRTLGPGDLVTLDRAATLIQEMLEGQA